MEVFAAVALSLAFLYGLYHVIRTGVRDGMTEALKRHTVVRADDGDPDRGHGRQ